MKKRVVVTGMGLVTPLGVGVDFVWQKLTAGQSGIGAITTFDTTDYPTKIAGHVPQISSDKGATADGGFCVDDWVDGKDLKKMDTFITYGISAADQALADAGWHPETETQQNRTGVVMGSGMGGYNVIEKGIDTLQSRGARRVSPFYVPASLINLISGHISMKHQLRGPNHALTTACATGTHAIGDASRMIQFGDADVMVAGGAESVITPMGIAGFNAARALSTSYNDTPETASRPWDTGRDGFVMGEGAGAVVLEDYDHAKSRGAKIYGEIVGYGMSGDAYHLTAPAEDGNGGYRAMQSALSNAGVGASDLDYINAHGTSTPTGDMIELRAIAKLLGSDTDTVAISSTKSSVGHLLGAAGAIEAVFSLKAMQTGIIPPTLNLHNPDEGVGAINLVPLTAQEKTVDVALSNSFGFGGTNASLVFKKV